MDEYKIVKYEDMKNILSVSEISPEKIYMYMYQMRADVLYITEKNCLRGVISIGDLYRHYAEKIPLKLNRDFRFVKSFDDENAEVLLKEIPSIHELPVVSEEGVFLGIIKAGEKGEGEWKHLKNCIDNERFGSEEEYLYEELKKWILRQRAKVIIYDHVSWEAWESMIPGVRARFKEKVKNASEKDILPLYIIKNMTETEQRKFFGENYSENCVQEFFDEYEKIELISENGIYSIKDLKSKYYTFRNGHRITPNNTGERYKIYLYGACHILGTYVSDNGTIEYFLKEELTKNGYPYDVINGGLWKGNRGHLWLYRMLKTDFEENDIIVVGELEGILELIKQDKSLENKYILFQYFGNKFNQTDDNILAHFLDDPYHYDAVYNRQAAENIFNDIRCLLRPREKAFFISWDTVKYYKKFFAFNGLVPLGEKTGTILMTCNPFTRGHRYLIETACKEVDLLYIFVVEEEVSGFSFQDRLNMVKSGTCDLEKVKVFPLGKYIATRETFPQYFDRDNVTEIEGTDYDIHIFANTIGKELGIRCRFVGEEPFDKVTRAYNETMKRVLVTYGIEVREIPRLQNEWGDVISATTARRYIKDGNIKKLCSLLPDRTIDYLKHAGIINHENNIGNYPNL